MLFRYSVLYIWLLYFNVFLYFIVRSAGCEHIRRVRFHHCAYVDDEALQAMVQRLKDTLQQLELSSCDISDAGLAHITQLKYVFCLLTNCIPM